MTVIWSSPDLFGRRSVIGVRAATIEVREIPKLAADATIRRLHYSASVVWSSNFHLGAFDPAGGLVGVLQFGPAMNPASGPKVVAGSEVDSWLELNRMVFSEGAPTYAASQAISGALRMIRHRRPKVEWIQSFADERCGRLGGVYQAASFLYCGTHIGRFVEIDGEIFHQSMVSRPLVDKRGWRCGPKVARVMANRDKARPIEFRQFRYIKTLTRNARRNLLLPALPYPKPAAWKAA